MSVAIVLFIRKIGQEGVVMRTYLMNMTSFLRKTKTIYLFMCPLPCIGRSVSLLVAEDDEFFTSRSGRNELYHSGKDRWRLNK